MLETVPGISSFSAGAALLNLSLCEKAEKMAILPCLSRVEAMRPDLERFDTVVLMKVGRRFADLRELLRGMGLLPYSHLLLKLGTPRAAGQQQPGRSGLGKGHLHVGGHRQKAPEGRLRGMSAFVLDFGDGSLEGLGESVVLRWKSGRVQRLSAATLRSQCQCAQCRHLAFPLEAPMFPGLKVDAAQPVGAYAIQFLFSDRHNTGAFPFEQLEGMPDGAGE